MPDIFVTQEENSQEGKEEVKVSETSNKVLTEEETDEASKPNLWLSYIIKPKDIDFEIREGNEKVILLLRQHPIVNLKWVLPVILMFFVPSIVNHYAFLSFLPGGYKVIALLFWYLIIFSISLLSFLDWYFDVELITDQRIIDIDFYSFIYKQVSDANLDKIQDVSYKMNGIFRTLFNFGDVFVQTASEVPNFDLFNVPNPDKIVKLLQDLRMEEDRKAAKKEAI